MFSIINRLKLEGFQDEDLYMFHIVGLKGREKFSIYCFCRFKTSRIAGRCIIQGNRYQIMTKLKSQYTKKV